MTTITTTTVRTNAAAILAELTKQAAKFSHIPKNDREDLAQNAYINLLSVVSKYGELKWTYLFRAMKDAVVDYHRYHGAQKRDAERTVSLSGDDRTDNKALDVEQCFTIAHSCDPWNGTPPQVAIAREYRDIARQQFGRLSADEQDALNARWQGVALDAKLGMRAKRAEEKLKKMLTS